MVSVVYLLPLIPLFGSCGYHLRVVDVNMQVEAGSVSESGAKLADSNSLSEQDFR
ncbi:hypothetical protein ZEAMMB73_Zm00001d050757, partial [Zea mays]